MKCFAGQELPTMSGMPSLVEVRLNGNKLTALEGVEDAQRLHTLHVANNCITSIMQLRPLSMCKSLCNLAITGNPLPKKLLSNHGHVALRNLLPGAKGISSAPPACIAMLLQSIQPSAVTCMCLSCVTSRTNKLSLMLCPSLCWLQRCIVSMTFAFNGLAAHTMLTPQCVMQGSQRLMAGICQEEPLIVLLASSASKAQCWVRLAYTMSCPHQASSPTT